MVPVVAGSIHGMVGQARESIELGCRAPNSCRIIMIFIRFINTYPEHEMLGVSCFCGS